MNKWGFLACILLLQMLALPAWAWEGWVDKVLDGDSIRVRRDGQVLELRLYGIDTPEYRQAYGNRARQFTREILQGQKVSVEEKDVDRYGRIVALVTCRGKLVNRELVRAGLAWQYRKYCQDQPLCNELTSLEQEARKERRGLWADPAPVSPWEWKRREKRGSAASPGWYRRLLDLW